MDYEKAYKEALERAKGLIDFCSDSELKTLENVFPELRESEDEKIRKSLLEHCRKQAEMYNTLQTAKEYNKVQSWIDWLEKQGECESNIDFKIEADKWYVCIKDYYYSDIDELMFTKGKAYKAYIDWGFISNNGTKKTPIGIFPYKEYFRPATDEEIPHEQKPTYNVESKFKVGDWIVRELDNTCYQIENCIINVTTNKYGYDLTSGGYISSQDANFYHLWTIQDTKAGDVLYDGSNSCIFRKKMEDEDAIWVDTYCGINSNGTFNVNDEDECWCLACDCTPATKEQRDLLFQKMKEAGYEWDAEKKKLKKIEKTTAWSERDELMFEASIGFIKSSPYPYSGDTFRGEISKIEAGNWLKSLKERYTWKPSEEQIGTLKEAIIYVESCESNFKGNGHILETLLEQLKKLREE